MEQLIVNVLYGVVSSAVVSAGGYLKTEEGKRLSLEEFDLVKFLKSVVLGGAIGGAVCLTGMSPNAVVALPMYAGLEVGVEYYVKVLVRKLRKIF